MKFNYERFISLDDRYEVSEYIKKCNLPIIGSGSSRIVYKISIPGYEPSVIKFSYSSNKFKYEQNKQEVYFYQNKKNKLIPRIFNWHPEFVWIEMEFLKAIPSTKKLLSLIGIERRSELSNADILPTHKSPVMKEAIKLVQDFGLVPCDITVPYHWGLDRYGKLKICDFGWTEEIRKKVILSSYGFL